jgi:uncharacterized protein YkwD
MKASRPLLLASLLLFSSCGRDEPVTTDEASVSKTTASFSSTATTVPTNFAEEKPAQATGEQPPKVEEPVAPKQPDPVPGSDEAPPPPSNPALSEEGIIDAAIRKTNEIRAEHGLPALEIDSALAAAAQKHAEDMKARGFYDHVSPDGKSPIDRMKESGAVFQLSGENIHKGVTDVDLVFKSWLDSKLHRDTLLHKAYRRHGIGYADGYWTHVFAD